MGNDLVLPLLLFVSIWELCWKGMALWKAAQKKHKSWFIALLILNTIGLLPIIYLGFFAKKKK